MDFGLTESQRAYRERVRQLIDGIDGDRMRAFWREQHEVGGDRMFPWAPSAYQMLCEEKLIGIDWPDPWGHGGETGDVYVVGEELVAGGFPASPTSSSSGAARSIIQHAQPEIVAEHLPRVLAGEWRYAGGLSEPEAGSDLFALTTTAERDGDDYVVNGSKLWTSYAHEAQFINTLVRTDPTSKRHRGLSELLIPLDAPGLEIQPVWVIGGWRVNQCYFDNVRVPVSNLLGEENNGAAILSAGLAAERSMSFGGTETRLLLTRVIHRFDDAADVLDVSDLESIGRFAAQLEIERLLNIAANAKGMRGEESSVAGSMGKVYGAELAQRFAQWLNEFVPGSLFAQEWGDETDDQLAADAEWFVRGAVTVSIAGGTSEIQRNAVAQRGLGLPRS